MRLRELIRIGSVLAALVLGSPQSRAEDTAQEDGYDILRLAIEFDLQCVMLQYFEQRYLRIAAERAYETSHARQTVEASADAKQAMADLNTSYRNRAKATECQYAMTYLAKGRSQAYAQLGQALLTAQYLRGQETVAPGFSPLTNEQRQLFGAFAQVGAQAYGADWETLDRYIQQLASVRMQDLASKSEAARLIELAFDWEAAFTTLRFQFAANAAGYVPRLAALGDGSEGIVMDAGTVHPYLVLAAGPQLVRVPLMSGEAVDAYSFLGVMPDGAALVAVYGEGAATLPAGIRQRLVEGVPVDGERMTEGCPFDVCFRIPADRIAMLVRTFRDSYLKSLVTERPTDGELESGGDRMTVGLARLVTALAGK